MTKMRNAAVFMAVLGLTSLLFAEAPKSLKKIATNDLIEDELVDNFDVGVDGAKGLWFAGYNGEYKDFNIGYGLYFGNIWVSVYDELSKSTFDNFKKATRDTDEVALDGMNVDYTNSKYTYTKGEAETQRNIENNLYAALSIKNIGGQLYWKLNDTTPQNTVTAEETTEKPAEGTTETLKDSGFRYRGTNDIGVYVNGIRTKDIGNVKFYVELTEVGAEWKRDIQKTKKDNSEENGTLTTKSTTVTKWFTNDQYTYLKPYAGMELGLTLPALGNSTNQFTLNEKFSYEIPFDTVKLNSEVVKEYDTLTGTQYKVTTVTKAKTNYGVTGSWENVMTPKLTSTYALGENLTVKTAIDADVTMGFSKSGTNAYKTSTTEVTNYNKYTDTETKTVTEKKEVVGTTSNYVTKTFETKIEPRTSIGMSYAVKPGKFDVYVGGLWNAGTLTFVNESQKMAKTETTTKVTTTDEFGKEKVTDDTKTVTYADTPVDDTPDASEYKKFDFKGSNPSQDKIWLGSTMYFTENMKMDLLYTVGFDTFSVKQLLDTSLSVSFAIKF